MNWKSWLSSPLVLVVGMAAAFFAGRSQAPAPEILEVEKRIEIHHEAEHTETKLDIEALRSLFSEFVQSSKRDVVKQKVTTTTPEGHTKTIETEVDKSTLDTKKTVEENTELRLAQDELKKLQKNYSLLEETLKSQKPAGLPTWNVGVFTAVVADATRLQILSGDSLVPGIPDQLMVGAYVERKLLWGTYLQGFVNTRGHVGLGLRLGF